MFRNKDEYKSTVLTPSERSITGMRELRRPPHTEEIKPQLWLGFFTELKPFVSKATQASNESVNSWKARFSRSTGVSSKGHS